MARVSVIGGGKYVNLVLTEREFDALLDLAEDEYIRRKEDGWPFVVGERRSGTTRSETNVVRALQWAYTLLNRARS